MLINVTCMLVALNGNDKNKVYDKVMRDIAQLIKTYTFIFTLIR